MKKRIRLLVGVAALAAMMVAPVAQAGVNTDTISIHFGADEPTQVNGSMLDPADVLLLDDWGMGAIDSATRSDLLEIIDDRAASKATIITSQLPIEHWHAWIGDATIADAILDRIMQRNHRFTLTGDSLRPEKQKPVKKEKTSCAMSDSFTSDPASPKY